jgi:hypothetical protein
MREIGVVKLLQVQGASLKVGARPDAYYDPAPLLAVERLLITPAGCVGVTAAGERIVDVHNAEHPWHKNRQGSNGVSLGFTGHYDAMRERFGAHLSDGIAGENILVEAGGQFALGDLGDAVVIVGAGGATAALTDLLVADPCVEFSRFVHLSADPITSDELRTTLQFLGDGMRGFYARPDAGQATAEVRVGDRVFARR